MKYEQIVKGTFIERPNRFIAYVNIDGKKEVVHVKNTGRCRELLIPGASVYLEKSKNPERKTAYDLIAVEKVTDQKIGAGEQCVRLINMDSQAPNKVVEEWLLKKELFPGLVNLRPETKYGASRFDFYAEYGDPGKGNIPSDLKRRAFIEVKGVTLERDGVVLFPDAPSDRAVKHVEELIQAKQDGYGAYIILVIQMSHVKYFLPNRETHPEFADALKRAADAGVQILAYDCSVTLRDTLSGKNVGNDSDTSIILCDAASEEILKNEKDTGVIERTKTELGLELCIRNPVPVYLSLENLNDSLKKERLFSISKSLLKWYDGNRRILPWREDPTPYHVWVSEIMLQQTRVEAVRPYYKRFMEALPDIESLAAADEQRLLKLWEGLGYYSRVRNLQKAAVQIMKEYDGVMPDAYEDLLKLKGIGSYTAGAIASIAYNRKVPAVDGNVLRVVSRICMDEGLITDPKVKQRMEADLKAAMSGERPGDFNQAMMEIGAMVCIPNGAPHCEVCPLAHICLAHENCCEEAFPKKAGKKPRTIEQKTVLIIQDANKAAIRKRPEKGLLAGMYEFPTIEGYKTAEEVVKYLSDSGLNPLRIKTITDSKHIFTHKEWHMKGYQVRVDELEPYIPCKETKDWLFIEPCETQEKYPVPSAFSAYVPYLNIKLGKDSFEEKEER